MRTDDILAIFHARLNEQSRASVDPRLPVPVDWEALFKRESNTEWLVPEIWPVGRQVHLHAKRKTGKSLITLWMACCLAVGRDPFSNDPIRPVVVAYLDYEMTEDDLLERVEQMGFTAEQLHNRLFYFLHPAIPMLDTATGGEALMETLTAYGVEAVIIDTLSRVVAGEENSNDTYINFYKRTGQLLKAAGIAMLRLDHEGHESGRSRGASAKADDVDLVWQLRAIDGGGFQFVRKAARIAWIPETVSIAKAEDSSLCFQRTGDAWIAGTLEKVHELDACDVPTDASRRTASQMLKDGGYMPGKTAVLVSALRYRQRRLLGV